MKKQVSLLLVLIILLSSNVYATNEINTPLVNSLETISIEDIPKNVKPLEFETEEELEGYNVEWGVAENQYGSFYGAHYWDGETIDLSVVNSSTTTEKITSIGYR